MTFGEKLLRLRKREGISQEELAGRINVSRQAVSRWENEGILPDAGNLLQLSQLFGTSVDYLLHDEYEKEEDLPASQQAQDDLRRWRNQQLGFLFSVGILGMVLLVQLVSWFVLQSIFFAILGGVLQIAAVVIFEATWRYAQREEQVLPKAYTLRRKYYLAAIWLISYTPVRIVCTMAWGIWPKPYHSLLKEVSINAVYLIICVVASFIWSRWSKHRLK